MLVIDNGDAIRGKAAAASVVDFTVNGYVGTTATQLADGQLGSSEADLYASSANATVVTSITLVNTDTSARTVDLYLKPSGGTSRSIIGTISLGIQHTLYTDGQRVEILNAYGELLCSWPVDDTPVDGETDHPISSNWAYDHTADIDAHVSGATAGQLLVATAATVASWQHTGVILQAPDISGSVSAASTLTMPAFTLGGTITGAAQELSNLGTVYIGDTANAKMTLGLTIRTTAADEILAGKSANVAHGATAQAETDTFFYIGMRDVNFGGLLIRGLTDSGVGTSATFEFIAMAGANADTTKATTSRSIMEFTASQITDTTYGNVVADGNIFGIRARVGAAWLTELILDEDGDLWLRGGLTGTTLTMSGASDVGTSCEADAYTVGGVAGIDHGPGDITSITVVKGIVTAVTAA